MKTTPFSYFCLLLFICFIPLFPLSAQQDFFVTQYDTQDGLPQKTVNSLQQDDYGYMWFATENGISRFDGRSFTNYRINLSDTIDYVSNRFSLLKKDAYDYFWLLNADSDLCRFNPRNGLFCQILNGTEYKAQSLDALPNGDVWVRMLNGNLYRIYYPDGKTIKAQKITRISAPIRNIFYRVNNGRKYVWVMTENEFLQYDTEKNCLIRHRLGNEESRFHCIRRYADHYLIGGDNGTLYHYYFKQKRFIKEKLPTASSIRNLKAFSTSHIIIITENDGFFFYGINNKSHTHFTTHTIGLVSNAIKSLYVDEKKNIWMTYNGANNHISTLDSQAKHIAHYTLKDRNGQEQTHLINNINILPNKDDLLFFHASGSAVNYFDTLRNDVVPLTLAEDQELLSFNNPAKIHLDKQQNLWMSKSNRGLIKVTFKKNLFTLTSPNSNDIFTTENELHGLMEDSYHRLWVGAADGSIRLFDAKRKPLGYLSPDGAITPKKWTPGIAQSMIEDCQGNIWIGTSSNGLIRLQPTKEKEKYTLTQYVHQPDDVYSLNSNSIYSLHESSDGDIWVGTFEKGLNYLEKSEGNQVRFIHSGNHLQGYPTAGEKIRCLQADKAGNLWIGTTGGIVQCETNFERPEELTFRLITHVANDNGSLSNNDVSNIFLTHDGQLYFATLGGGVCRLESFDAQQARFHTYRKGNGLLSDFVYALQEDADGRLWIASDEGISRFSPEEEHFAFFDNRFFPSDIQFTDGRALRTDRKELVFGTDRGFLSFRPETVRKGRFKPTIAINQLLIKDSDKGSNEQILWESDLNDSTQLTLPHRNNSFTVQYVALDMKYPNKIEYAYQLDGFDGWNYVGDDVTATYTNVPTGDYIFRVKSTNSDGVWVDNERTIRVTIEPSFWESAWGILLGVLLFIGVVGLVTYILLVFYKLKAKVTFEQQLAEFKNKSFTDIVHELRTPFTLIIAPLEHVLSTKGIPDAIYQDLKLIQHNTQRTIKLINQILDIQKIQHNKMKLRIQRVELYSFAEHIIAHFDSLAQTQETEIVLNATSRDMEVWIDADKIEGVLFNLISNSFKYSSKGKQITIDLKEEKEEIILSVIDQGMGIAPEKQQAIFARFENIVPKQFQLQASTGIGLSLVKEIVELHKGNIQIESRPNEGTTVSIRLQKGKEHFDKETEFILSDYQFDENYEKQLIDFSMPDTEAEDPQDDRPTLLLVEDNNQLRHFLQTILSEDFHAIAAQNGEEGLQKALQYNPDMIISDVVMPVMNGIEMVKQIRSNIAICHIPIVLLTSRNTVENQIEGFAAGIESYITKPFSANYLRARIFNLLEQRKRLQALYCSQLMNPTEQKEEAPEELATLSTYDKQLIDNIVSYIKTNITDSTLSVENIAKEMNLSRSALFKKVKLLTGLAPVELIKNIRIRQSVKLMEEGKMNLTEIAYATGFSDSHYFSKCFKQVYGMTPSEYKRGIQSGNMSDIP